MATIRSSASGGVAIQMQVPGATAVNVRLTRFGGLITNWTPFWREYAAPLIFDRIQDNFKTEGGWVGGWKPLSPAYAAWKVRHYGQKPILQRTGTLVRSLTWQNGAVGPGGIAEMSETRAAFGTRVPYAIYHQLGAAPRRASAATFATVAQAAFGFGGKARKRPEARSAGLPKRQIIRLPESETMGRLLHRFIIDQLAAAREGA